MMDDDKGSKMVKILPEHKMRFYQSEFPKEGELVKGESEKSEENGCYVALLEYNNKTGMMPINEYTTTMKKAIHRAMKVGKQEILRVIRVDREKGYIDLSKKQVSPEDEVEGEQKYANSTQLHSILIHISKGVGVPVLELYQKYIWPIYKKHKEDHPLTLLKHAMIYEDKLDEFNIQDEKIKTCLLNQFKRRFKKPTVKTMASFSVSIRSFEGIQAIKDTLLAGIQASKEKGYDVKISIIGAPKYICEVSSTTKESGRDALLIALKEIENGVKGRKGEFSVDKQPFMVGDTNQHMKDLIKEEEGKEVLDGDDSDMGSAEDD